MRSVQIQKLTEQIEAEQDEEEIDALYRQKIDLILGNGSFSHTERIYQFLFVASINLSMIVMPRKKHTKNGQPENKGARRTDRKCAWYGGRLSLL